MIALLALAAVLIGAILIAIAASLAGGLVAVLPAFAGLILVTGGLVAVVIALVRHRQAPDGRRTRRVRNSRAWVD